MKYFYLIPVLLMVSFIGPAKKTKIVFFGDSITQQGAGPKGYITKMDSLIRQNHLENDYELVGAGISGHKVYDLYLRMDADVIAKKPDLVVIYIGINDVWHKRTSGTGTDPDRFDRFYRAIINKLKENNIKVILCTPSVIGERTDFTNELDGDLNSYSNAVRNIAKDFSLPVCDLRQAFLDYIRANNPTNTDRGILTYDRVHLNEAGNIFVASEMWKTIRANP